MAKIKPKRRPKGRPLDIGEQQQIADERVQRRMHARAKRIRALVRAVDRESARLDSDLEHFSMAVLHDRGFVVVGKKEHNDLIDENLQLRQDLERQASAKAPV
jgi:hypothetical protein